VVCIPNYHLSSLILNTQVISPLQAILEYEIAQGIPPGYINATIASHSPKGAWQKLERGEVSLSDNSFFTTFGSELSDPKLWTVHCQKLSKSDQGREALALVKKANGGKVDPTTGFPKMPEIDARKMFWNMMRLSRQPDPYVFPALRKLKESGRFVIAALSNTIEFPPGVLDDKGQKFESGSSMIKEQFDVFVSSAHLGMRKPERRIYDYALEEARKIASSRGMGSVEFEDVCFLDDIGTNLKAAMALGMKTIKVPLGKSQVAVKELESVIGMKLLDESKL